MNTLLMSLMIMIMSHEMPKLPYANNALEPVISQQTIDYHYGKHLQTYVNNLNNCRRSEGLPLWSTDFTHSPYRLSGWRTNGINAAFCRYLIQI